MDTGAWQATVHGATQLDMTERMSQGCTLGKRNYFTVSLLISQVTVVSNSDLVRSRQRL